MEINGRKRVQSTMAKYSKPEVSYRPAIGGAKRRCSNCINYQENENGCTMVEGRIKPNNFCNLLKLKLPPPLEENPGESFRLGGYGQPGHRREDGFELKGKARAVARTSIKEKSHAHLYL